MLYNLGVDDVSPDRERRGRFALMLELYAETDSGGSLQGGGLSKAASRSRGAGCLADRRSCAKLHHMLPGVVSKD